MKVLNGTDLQMYIKGTKMNGSYEERWNFIDNSVDLYTQLEKYKLLHPDVIDIEIHIALPVVNYSKADRIARPISIEVPNVD